MKSAHLPGQRGQRVQAHQDIVLCSGGGKVGVPLERTKTLVGTREVCQVKKFRFLLRGSRRVVLCWHGLSNGERA
jgi:hypothetical protein